MKNIAKIAMAASVFMMPFAANATPLAGTYVDLNASVSKGLNLDCKMTAQITDTGTGFQITSLHLENGLCPLVDFSAGLPYDVQYVGNGTGSFTIKDVDVNTITFGGCFGDVHGTYDMTATPPTLTISYQTIPAKIAGTGDCSVSAVLKKQ